MNYILILSAANSIKEDLLKVSHKLQYFLFSTNFFFQESLAHVVKNDVMNPILELVETLIFSHVYTCRLVKA